MPMMSLFDKQIQLRMGQANEALDPSHSAVRTVFQRKADGAVKIMLKPWSSSSRIQ